MFPYLEHKLNKVTESLLDQVPSFIATMRVPKGLEKLKNMAKSADVRLDLVKILLFVASNNGSVIYHHLKCLSIFNRGAMLYTCKSSQLLIKNFNIMSVHQKKMKRKNDREL